MPIDCQTNIHLSNPIQAESKSIAQHEQGSRRKSWKRLSNHEQFTTFCNARNTIRRCRFSEKVQRRGEFSEWRSYRTLRSFLRLRASSTLSTWVIFVPFFSESVGKEERSWPWWIGCWKQSRFAQLLCTFAHCVFGPSSCIYQQLKVESHNAFAFSTSSLLQSGVLGKPFQKMRRRLTVTGSSETIDGGVQKNHAEEETAKAQTKKKVRLY